MKLNKQKAKLINQAIESWQQDGKLTDQQAKDLSSTIEVVSFDWRLLANYSFWIAVACAVIAVIVLIADDYIIELISTLIALPKGVIALILAGLASYGFYHAIQLRERGKATSIRVEATFFVGILLTAASVTLFSHTNWLSHLSPTYLLFALTCLYLALGYLLNSQLTWLFGLITLGGWYMLITSNSADNLGYFLGLNIPIRVMLLGGVLVAIQHFLPNRYQTSCLFIGLLYFSIGLWLFSIVGNYQDLVAWSKVSQLSFLPWAIFAIVVNLMMIIYGIKTSQWLFRSFGLVFLLINCYSRFFEYFWQELHTTLFFTLLAASFWVLGNYAERLWLMGYNGPNTESD